ncbi:helix-turn-helix domain-containing protein [Jeotgalibacillus aurantiacus]|uniref:helix-turn-helix domain-containing protein n=1 Tax=Jeotgalibacillus aurantiacus TaxID=2763266 RepID=UPI001D0A776F|nr:helix-turn-helix domain-containing protein [Jeotgalibacillus aurantiacus]
MKSHRGTVISTDFVSAMMDQIDRGIHVVDPNGRTIFYNQKMREMEAMNDIDLLDKRLQDIFQFHPDERSTLLQALASKKPILNVRQSYFNVNGHEIMTLNDTFPIIVNGDIAGAIEVARELRPVDQTKDTKPPTLSSFDHWTGSSPLVAQMIFEGKKAAHSNDFLLLCGEAGSGKELLAQSIHLERGYQHDAFHAIDFRTASAESIDRFFSEMNEPSNDPVTYFMGHVEYLELKWQELLNQHLVAEKQKRGRDSLKQYYILTLSQDPIDAVQDGLLKKDLYYTVSERTIFVPSLRERIEDIKELTDYFIEDFNARFQTSVRDVSEEVLHLFSSYDWPGNVRELEHVMEASMFALGNDQRIEFTHLPHYFRLKFDDPASPAPVLDSSAFMVKEGKASQTLDAFLQEAESYYIQKSLQYHDHNITKTADALGMSRQNLQYRMKKNGLLRLKK